MEKPTEKEVELELERIHNAKMEAIKAHDMKAIYKLDGRAETLEWVLERFF